MDEYILIYVNLFPQIKECSRVLELCREWVTALSGSKIGVPSGSQGPVGRQPVSA